LTHYKKLDLIVCKYILYTISLYKDTMYIFRCTSVNVQVSFAATNVTQTLNKTMSVLEEVAKNTAVGHIGVSVTFIVLFCC